MKYVIDCHSWYHEGGYCQFYPIKKFPNLGFKEFRNKKKAQFAYNIQKKLSKLDLAPKLYSSVCRLPFLPEQDYWLPEFSDWGYVTEIAKEIEYTNNSIYLSRVQKLVNDIFLHTNLKFWDCHFSNVGLIERDGKSKVVCIDTGKESFDGYANAWGFASPGPKCCYCNKYQCKCPEE